MSLRRLLSRGGDRALTARGPGGFIEAAFEGERGGGEKSVMGAHLAPAFLRALVLLSARTRGLIRCRCRAGTYGTPDAHVFTLKKITFGDETKLLPCVCLLTIYPPAESLGVREMREGASAGVQIAQAEDEGLAFSRRAVPRRWGTGRIFAACPAALCLGAAEFASQLRRVPRRAPRFAGCLRLGSPSYISATSL